MVTSCIAPLTSYKTSRHQSRTVGAGPDVACEQALLFFFAILSPNREPVHRLVPTLSILVPRATRLNKTASGDENGEYSEY